MFNNRNYNRTFFSAPQSVTSFVAAFLEPLLSRPAFLPLQPAVSLAIACHCPLPSPPAALVREGLLAAVREFLEKTVRGLIKGKKGTSLQVLNKKELKRHGLNLHLAVNQGSNNSDGEGHSSTIPGSRPHITA